VFSSCSKDNNHSVLKELPTIKKISENPNEGIFFSSPEKVLVDSNYIWILDGSVGALYKYNQQREFIKKIELPTGKGQANFPDLV
jgi:hypothetical protein